MRLTIKETAELMGISIRTLHYYDEIGLLVPEKKADNGYRFYDTDDIMELQQILFFKKLDFSLKEIQEMMSSSSYDCRFALERQRGFLLSKRHHLDEMISMIDKVLGGNPMTKENEMKSEAELTAQYAEEVKLRWGNTPAYREFQEKEKNLDDSSRLRIKEDADRIFAAFAERMDCDPGAEDVQQLVQDWQHHISENYYHCTKEILACLGKMYTADERFRRTLDRFGDGNADFIAEAIEIYCEN
ncbi:MAG: MerR family transcriptional regulator [Clostridia bacterium]